MSSATHRAECTAKPILYVGVELSAAKWFLVMTAGPGGGELRRKVAAGDGAAVVRALSEAKEALGLPLEAPVWSCCEAGRDGFWPHRVLTSLGVENVVVDSSSIEVPRGRKRVKTDKIDGQKLATLRWRHAQGERGMWREVHVPSVAQEDERHASRTLTSVVEDRTRYRNRIHSLLATHGVRRLPIDGRLPARLATLVTWDGQPLPPGVQGRILVEWRLLQAVMQAYTQLRQAERARVAAGRTAPAAGARQLARLRGIAARTAAVIGDELLSRAPRNRREIGGLLGFGTVPAASGQRHGDHGISPGGVRALRRIAVDVAWAWVRYQPQSALARWYARRFGGGGPATRKIGIVGLARRLFIALWRYTKTGVPPAGALLKA